MTGEVAPGSDSGAFSLSYDTPPADTTTQPTTSPTTKPAAMQSIYMPFFQYVDKYSGDYFPNQWLTGDWGGARQHLVDNGIIFEASATQIMQGNAHGGKSTNNAFRYSGSVDYYLKFDTARMNLWPGGVIVLHGQTQFGQSINGKVGSLMPANTQALFPVPDDPGETTLSEFWFAQALSEWLFVAAGKVDPTRLADTNTFANNYKTQFMNLGLQNNPVVLPYAPYTSMAAAVIIVPTEWLQVLTAVVDADSTATRTGFDTAFHSPEAMSVAQEWDFTIKPFGKVGHQRIGWAYSTKNHTVLQSDPRIGFQLSRGATSVLRSPRFSRLLSLNRARNNVFEEYTDNWAVWYNFDQYIYNEEQDPNQGVGVFGRFGWAPSKDNPINTFYSVGLGGQGVIPGRDNDTCGLGYYYVNMSDRLDDLGFSSEQGVEVYYNIEVTPWLHISPDLQFIVNPGGGIGDRDVAIVYGVRAEMSF